MKKTSSGGSGDTPTLQTSDFALANAPVSLSFDLYNNASPQVINYTTSSTGTVSVSESNYVSTVVDTSNKTITVTPTKRTNGAVEITVSQAADATYEAGSATFTVTIGDSTPKTGGWYETTISDIASSDVFVIVGNNGNNYAMTNDNGTSNPPSATGVSIENGELTSDVNENMKWNISGNATDGYTFYPAGTTDTWLYCTNTNNGVRVGTNDNKTFTIAGEYLLNSATSRYVGVYDSQDWRCYDNTTGNIANQTFNFYKYEAVAKPVIEVASEFYFSTTASISCEEGAAIKYSYDGENWNNYASELTITSSTTIYAKAVKGNDESSVVSATTTKNLAPTTMAISGELTTNLDGQTSVSAGTLTAVVSYNDAAVDGATVTWESSNTAIAEINASGEVTIKARGEVTFTATFTANSDYSGATATKTITVKDNNTLALNTTTQTTTYNTPLTIGYQFAEGYDGALVCSETPVADVTISANQVTFTPKAVGTASVTLSAPATTTFNAVEGIPFTFTVTAPEAQTTAAPCVFKKVTATSEITNGQYLIVYEGGNVAFNGGLETLDAVSNTISVTINEGKIESNETTNAAVFNINPTAGTLQSASGKFIGVSTNSNGLKQTDNAETYTNSFSIDNNGNAVIAAVFEGSNMTMQFNSASNQTRFRYFGSGQQAIQLYKLTSGPTVTLNASGYATYCSEHPLDFSSADDFTAWQVTAVENNVITFERITEAVKGGTGVLLKGTAGATVTLNSAESDTELNSNLLVGTIVPTYISANQYYGLSGKSFVKVNAGTIPAHKALLPASLATEPSTGQVKSFTFVFNDLTTGVKTIEKVSAEDAAKIFDLSGRRLSKPTKGINIINGKKVLVK